MLRVGKSLLMVAAIVATGALANSATAAPIIFANFAQTNPNNPGWVFTNAGAGSTFNLAATPVSFVSSGGLGMVLSYTGPAVATMSTTVTGPALGLGGIDRQGITGTLSFANGVNNVLTIVFTGSIIGIDGSNSTGTGADSNIVGQAIAYSSDYLVGAFIAPFSFSIALSQNPSLGIASTGPGAGYLNSFTASGTGNFSSDAAGVAPVPLPAAAWGGLSMLGVLGGASAIRRRRAAR